MQNLSSNKQNVCVLCGGQVSMFTAQSNSGLYTQQAPTPETPTTPFNPPAPVKEPPPSEMPLEVPPPAGPPKTPLNLPIGIGMYFQHNYQH